MGCLITTKPEGQFHRKIHAFLDTFLRVNSRSGRDVEGVGIVVKKNLQNTEFFSRNSKISHKKLTKTIALRHLDSLQKAKMKVEHDVQNCCNLQRQF